MQRQEEDESGPNCWPKGQELLRNHIPLRKKEEEPRPSYGSKNEQLQRNAVASCPMPTGHSGQRTNPTISISARKTSIWFKNTVCKLVSLLWHRSSCVPQTPFLVAFRLQAWRHSKPHYFDLFTVNAGILEINNNNVDTDLPKVTESIIQYVSGANSLGFLHPSLAH